MQALGGNNKIFQPRKLSGVQYLVFRAWYLWCYGKLPKVDYGGWEILLLPPRACTNIMTGTNHLLGRAHGGKYSLELKLLHRVLIWDD